MRGVHVTVHLASDGPPAPHAAGIYAVRVGGGLVKFGHSRSLAARLTTHARALRHLGVEFVAVWAPCVASAAAERDLLARLSRSGFERQPSSEAFAIDWDVALRMVAAAAVRHEPVLG